VIERGGDPWFIHADACAVLSLANPRQVASRLDDDEKGVLTVDTLGGPQEMTVINESGLWSLVLTSRKPEAKRFKKWITSEVIPAIRKTGGYIVATQDETPEELALRALQVLQATVERQKAIIAEAQPKVAFAEQVAVAPDAIGLGQAAKILGTGRNRLSSKLKELGWLTRFGEPYQDKINQGLLDVKIGQWEHPDKGLQRSVTALVTGKGLSKLHTLIGTTH